MGSTQGLWPRTAHKLQLNMKLAPSTSEVDQLTIIIGLRLHILLVNERAAVFTASAPCTTCCFKPSFSIPAQYIRKEHIMQTISFCRNTLNFWSAKLPSRPQPDPQHASESPEAGYYESKPNIDPYSQVYNQFLKSKPAGSKCI